MNATPCARGPFCEVETSSGVCACADPGSLAALFRREAESRKKVQPMPDFDFGDVHPSIKHFEDAFRYKHLPEGLQILSRPFGDLAHSMVFQNPDGGPEVAAGLRKLLEAKDCFVRAYAMKYPRSE